VKVVGTVAVGVTIVSHFMIFRHG